MIRTNFFKYYLLVMKCFPFLMMYLIKDKGNLYSETWILENKLRPSPLTSIVWKPYKLVAEQSRQNVPCMSNIHWRIEWKYCSVTNKEKKNERGERRIQCLSNRTVVSSVKLNKFPPCCIVTGHSIEDYSPQGDGEHVWMGQIFI